MKLIVLSFFLNLYASMALGQLQVQPLYEADAFIPNTFIPFQVKGEGETKITYATLTSSKDVCKLIMDPYSPDVFLIKCLSPVTHLTLNLSVIEKGRLVSVDFGPLAIRVPFDGYEVVPPKDPTDDTDLLEGKQLFSARCLNCHNPPTSKRNASASDINRGIANEPFMNGAKVGQGGVDLKDLSASEVEKIEKYLGSL